jgi:parvulin-like peptidyl-prolyl isomerase
MSGPFSFVAVARTLHWSPRAAKALPGPQTKRAEAFMPKRCKRRFIVPLLRGVALALAVACGGQSAAEQQPHTRESEVFARIGERVITLDEYQSALATGVRQKYYHARPPEEELAKFRREVGEQLIERVLLAAEAERRGIEPDRARIESQVAEYDRRYAASAQWRAVRAGVLPRLIGELERRSRLERLEAAVRAVPPPSQAEARAYYEATPAPFTEPERLRLSLILLKVDPASPASAWDAALAEGERLHRKLLEGADFGALAQLHSADPSAEKGGDLGYVHRGMVPETLQKQVIDSLQSGAFSPPVRLLEGVAIVRLDARQAPRLRAFADVAQRARELLQRERGEQAWNGLIAQLRAAADVQVDESRYAPAPQN